MKAITAIAAIAVLVSSIEVQAAQDMGLSFNSSQSSVTSRGFGAQANVTLKFGDRRTVAASQKLAVGIAAGPVMGIRDGRTGSVRDQLRPTLGLTVRPGYSTSLNLAGQPLATGYTRLGAAEEKQGKKTGKKIGTAVAIAALAAGAVVGGLILLQCRGPGCGD